jgi:formamidopyrimidine-DNA glycosylase
MPELPEITVIAGQMNSHLAGRSIVAVDVAQPKCLNVPVPAFELGLVGKSFRSVEARGKWLFGHLAPHDHLLLNLGMGADLLWRPTGASLPEKHQLSVVLDDGSGFTARFWWFGYAHLVPEGGLPDHKMTSDLGLSPLDPAFTVEHLAELLKGRRSVKGVLTDQRSVAGIGNVYVQDMLFRPRIHPLRQAGTISPDEVRSLHEAVIYVLRQSVELGGLKYERDFLGQSGRYDDTHFEVAYKDGKPCPACGTIVAKIRTGSTSSYICAQCQTL